jgi:hypothetical protein
MNLAVLAPQDEVLLLGELLVGEDALLAQLAELLQTGDIL